MALPLVSDNLSGVIPIDGQLRIVERHDDALQGSRADAEARQTQHERERAYRALQQAEERLEMFGRNDMAIEVRKIRARLAMGR